MLCSAVNYERCINAILVQCICRVKRFCAVFVQFIDNLSEVFIFSVEMIISWHTVANLWGRTDGGDTAIKHTQRPAALFVMFCPAPAAG